MRALWHKGPLTTDYDHWRQRQTENTVDKSRVCSHDKKTFRKMQGTPLQCRFFSEALNDFKSLLYFIDNLAQDPRCVLIRVLYIGHSQTDCSLFVFV